MHLLFLSALRLLIFDMAASGLENATQQSRQLSTFGRLLFPKFVVCIGVAPNPFSSFPKPCQIKFNSGRLLHYDIFRILPDLVRKMVRSGPVLQGEKRSPGPVLLLDLRKREVQVRSGRFGLAAQKTGLGVSPLLLEPLLPTQPFPRCPSRAAKRLGSRSSTSSSATPGR